MVAMYVGRLENSPGNPEKRKSVDPRTLGLRGVMNPQSHFAGVGRNDHEEGGRGIVNSVFRWMSVKVIAGLLLLLTAGVVWGWAVPLAFKYYETAEAEQDALEQARSKWPTVQGIVLTSSMQMDDVPTVTVEFEYQVHGVRYLGEQYWYRSLFGSPAKLSEENYWPEKTVPIYYNPTNPAEAFVAPEISGSTWVGLAVFYLMLLGVALVLFGICWGVWLPLMAVGKRKAASAAGL